MFFGLLGGYEYKNKRGEKYYLHKWESKKGKRKTYYFSKKKKGACSKPWGYTVEENPKSGFPVLRKKRMDESLF